MSAMPARVSYDVHQGTLGEKCVAGGGAMVELYPKWWEFKAEIYRVSFESLSERKFHGNLRAPCANALFFLRHKALLRDYQFMGI